MQLMAGYVCILTARRSALHVGVTSGLGRRSAEHKSGSVPGHTSKYNIGRLLYAEVHESMEVASAGEKQIERWRREKKRMPVRIAIPELCDVPARWL